MDFGLVEVHLVAVDPLVQAAGDLEGGVIEDRLHATVLRQYLGGEASDAVAAGDDAPFFDFNRMPSYWQVPEPRPLTAAALA